MSYQSAAPSASPLSDDELNELDEFLLAVPEGEERLTIDECHGYLTALAVCGAELDQNEVQEAVWGLPEFNDDSQAHHLKHLLQRMDDEIRETLAANTPFEPLVIEEEDDESGEVIELYEGWCFGFMLGVADQNARWESLPKEQGSLLEPIATLALLHSDDEELDMDDDEYEEWAGLISGSINGLHAYWRQ